MTRLWGERVIRPCLVQVLDYEAQKHLKKKRVLECNKCPLKDKCERGEKNDNDKSSERAER